MQQCCIEYYIRPFSELEYICGKEWCHLIAMGGHASASVGRRFVTNAANSSCIPSLTPCWTHAHILRSCLAFNSFYVSSLVSNYTYLCSALMTIKLKILREPPDAKTYNNDRITIDLRSTPVDALLYWIYLKIAPSCWPPSNGVSPTFTRRFNNYGLFMWANVMSTFVCILHSYPRRLNILN